LFVAAMTPLLSGCTTLTTGDTVYWATLERADDRITLTEADNTAIFDIHSARGIGGATVQWLAGAYPEQTLFRFHLQGLEMLRFAYGAIVIELSIPSVGDGSAQQSVSSAPTGASSAQTITPESRYWMKTELVGRNAGTQNPVPLTEGWIEVQVPSDFIATRSRTFSIQWIDFYR
jgi:hypothetical protein